MRARLFELSGAAEGSAGICSVQLHRVTSAPVHFASHLRRTDRNVGPATLRGSSGPLRSTPRSLRTCPRPGEEKDRPSQKHATLAQDLPQGRRSTGPLRSTPRSLRTCPRGGEGAHQRLCPFCPIRFAATDDSGGQMYLSTPTEAASGRPPTPPTSAASRW